MKGLYLNFTFQPKMKFECGHCADDRRSGVCAEAVTTNRTAIVSRTGMGAGLGTTDEGDKNTA
jgi:hypothetical protein